MLLQNIFGCRGISGAKSCSRLVWNWFGAGKSPRGSQFQGCSFEYFLTFLFDPLLWIISSEINHDWNRSDSTSPPIPLHLLILAKKTNPKRGTPPPSCPLLKHLILRCLFPKVNATIKDCKSKKPILQTANKQTSIPLATKPPPAPNPEKDVNYSPPLFKNLLLPN